MLPPRVGPAELHVQKAKRRVELAHVRAPAKRHPEPAQPIVEHRARRQRRRGAEELQTERGRRERRELRGIGEEREHVATWPPDPDARVQDVVGHRGHATIA